MRVPKIAFLAVLLVVLVSVPVAPSRAAEPVGPRPLPGAPGGSAAAPRGTIPASAAGSLSATSPSAASPDPALRSSYVDTLEVSLVILHVTVLDKRGEPVMDLEPKDFRIFEDGVMRAVSVFGSSSDQAVRVAFLLDVSGSMGLGGKLQRAKDAIRAFAGDLLPQDEIALLIFADGEVVVKLAFTSDRGAMNRALDGLQAYGRTALRNALGEAPYLLSATSPGRKALVILTDGADNASTISTFEAIQSGRRAAVPIFAVGITDLPLDLLLDRRPLSGGRSVFETLTEFTKGTGGEFFPVFSPKEVQAAVVRMGERLRGQYIVGYRPGPTSDIPGFHKIEVSTGDPHMQVLTRKGYVTSE